jgi:hypothetical protein
LPASTIAPESTPASGAPVHTPAAHVPIEHGVPSDFAGFEHCPDVVSQVPTS